jgi:MYXO-CTERM domain-containing protein
MKFSRQILALAVGLGLAHAAHAVSQEFIMPGNQLPGACHQAANANAGTSGNTYQCAAEGSYDYTVDVNAFAAATGSAFQAAKIEDWSGGFGVSYSGESGTSPEHAMDNNGKLEMLMFSFDTSFALSNVTIGWPSSTYDTDISILAWTGAGDPRTAVTGSNENNLLATGWDLVGHYGNLNDYEARAVNGSAVSSSYWIVSAFSKYGDASAPSWDGSKDFMKLYSIKGQFTCVNSNPNDPSCNPGGGGGGNVSEPGSIALAGLALVGVFGVRRRRAQQSA